MREREKIHQLLTILPNASMNKRVEERNKGNPKGESKESSTNQKMKEK